ncbi:MAG: hypothetical protein HC875_09780 [Anaerolineales bacterium]|nr:hypothetical protein [Anaerolineales bacterium]
MSQGKPDSFQAKTGRLAQAGAQKIGSQVQGNGAIQGGARQARAFFQPVKQPPPQD